MRVALDATPLLDRPTGVGRYVRELAHALEGQGVDVTLFAVAWRGKKPADVRRFRLPARVAHWTWRRFGYPAVEEMLPVQDVLHGTNFVLPAARRTPGVVTVHDLSYLQDYAFPGKEQWRVMTPWSIARAERVIVPSRAVAEEVSAHFGLGDERVAVTHEGVSEIFFRAPPLSDSALAERGIGRPFALAAGALEPRKNLRRLLDAWASLDASIRGEWTLVLAGPSGWGPDLPPTEGVVLTGWLGDESLPGLYAASDAFLFPSLYEGFGLPPLEAMAAGTPVLAGRYSAAPEVVGDAALLVDPRDTEDIARGLASLLQDDALRRRLSHAGKARATLFTWERAARATSDVYRSVIA